MLLAQEMMLGENKYSNLGIADNYCLASISDFNSLITMSQRYQVPIFSLSEKQIGQVGVVLERTLRSKAIFERIFSTLADMIVKLTNDAVGP